jgi:cytochrome b6-f complex iron-sulfur subunit
MSDWKHFTCVKDGEMTRKHNNETRNVEPSRRSFLTKLWVGLGFVALAEFIAVIVGFLRPREDKPGEANAGAVIICGPVEKFAPNSVTAFVNGRFYLACLEDGGFLALSRKCTHLGCTVPWDAKAMRFACPCHASAFDITGNVVNAPAPRALDRYPVLLENNMVKVDTRKAIKRSEFRADQVTYPEKQ